MNTHLKLAVWLTGLLTTATLQLNSAQANVVDLGAKFSPTSFFYEHEFDTPKANFIDWYGFSINPSNADVLTATISLGEIYGIKNMQTRLFRGYITNSGSLVNQGWLTTGITTNYMEGDSVLTLNEISNFALTGGNYLIKVTGSTDGLAGGYYTGVANFLDLPEPNIANLMVLGLGLIGIIKLRSKFASDKKSKPSLLRAF